MKLGIIGATGKTGHAVLQVARARNIEVTAIVRNASRLNSDVSFIEKNIFDLTTEDLKQFDVILCTFASSKKSDYPRVNQHLVDILSCTDTRLIVVGSGSTLTVDDTRQKTVGDKLPIVMRNSSRNHMKAREILQHSKLNWTYMAPPMNYLPDGETTGHYQVGHDVLLHDHNGDSSISYTDMALALVDEIQNPQNEQQLMTVAWK